MKLKLFYLGITLSVLLFTSCNNTLDSLGMKVLPGADSINIVVDTIYNMSSQTIKVDSVYARSISGYLGNFYDPTYGNVKGSYICQFYSAPKLVFPDSIVNNHVDSVKLCLYYHSWVGDSLAPMQVTVYPVKSNITLPKNFYTNVDPSKYCNIGSAYKLASKNYTARNYNQYSPVRFYNIYASVDSSYYLPIKMPLSIGQQLLNTWKDPSLRNEYYNTLANFTKLLPGFYLTTTYGNGNMLDVTATQLFVYYKGYYPTGSVAGKDTVETSASTFPVTKEVLQLNKYENTMDNSLLQNDPQKTYIKSPAGLYTEITLPIAAINKKLIKNGKPLKLVNARLTLGAYGAGEWDYALPLPNNLLLVRKDSANQFFENYEVPDSKNNYSATLNNYSYDFGNISTLVRNAIAQNPTKDVELYVIPISFSQYYYNATYYTYATTNYFLPSGVTLKKSSMNLQIIATDLQ